MEGAAPVVRLVFSAESVRDEGFGQGGFAQAAVRDAGVHDQLRLVEVGDPGRVRITGADPAELGVGIRDRGVGRAVVAEGGVGEGFAHREHGQHARRRPCGRSGLVLGRRDECEGVSGLVLVGGLEAHAGEDVGHELTVVDGLGQAEGFGELGACLVVLAGVEVRPSCEARQLGRDAVQAVPQRSRTLLLEEINDIAKLADDRRP